MSVIKYQAVADAYEKYNAYEQRNSTNYLAGMILSAGRSGPIPARYLTCSRSCYFTADEVRFWQLN